MSKSPKDQEPQAPNVGVIVISPDGTKWVCITDFNGVRTIRWDEHPEIMAWKRQLIIDKL